MNHVKDIIITFCIAFIVAFVVGFIIAKGQYAPPSVTSETLLRAMQNEGFFVTESIILEETVTIDNRSGNALKDFFVSEHIEAEANVKIAMGIDTNQLTAEDIQIDGKNIIVTVPTPTIFSTEVLGDVDIDAQRGVITNITKGDEDYNGLVATLKEQARSSVTDQDIAGAVQLGTIETVSRFINIVAPQYTAVIRFE
jgi:hypothetical protein